MSEPGNATAAAAMPAAPAAPGATDRRDAWWVGPAVTAAVLTAFIVYGTFRAFMNRWFEVGPYLSPFYSPNIEEWFGREALHGFSPALFILPIPGLFRLTCYYYRKAYYRAFFWDPPACAVSEKPGRYRGETGFLIWQNLHRFALYLAAVVNVFLWIDVFRSFYHQGELGAGVGSAVLLVNTVLITCYTLSCHSLRHLVGGCRDCFGAAAGGAGGAGLQHRLWRGASVMNERHAVWAWLSLASVMFADFYVWMVASGRLRDLNTWDALSGVK